MPISQNFPRRKRSLRVLLSQQGVHLLGECVRCSRQFKAQNDSELKDVATQFDAHVCSVEDVRRTGTQIVSRAGLSFFSS